MDEPIETVEHDSHKIKIYQDELPESPRNWDNLGTMVCWHRNYNLGDEQPKSSPNEFLPGLAIDLDHTLEDKIEHWENGKGWAHLSNEYDDAVKRSDGIVSNLIADVLDNNAVMLPLSLFDHSGITMNTTGFSCPWDSGQVGWIYISYEKIRKEYNWKNLTKQRYGK